MDAAPETAAGGPPAECHQTDTMERNGHRNSSIETSICDEDAEFLRITEIAEQINDSRKAIDKAQPIAGGMQPAQILKSNDEKITAKNLRYVKRLMTFWDQVQDVIYPIRAWPVKIQLWFLMVHKRHLTRVNCAKFLLGNGVPPDVVYAHVMCIWDGTTMVHADYDSSARNDVNNVIKHHEKEFRTGAYNYYDLATRRVQSWK